MARATNMLTDTAARNAKPKEKTYRLTDVDGMYLEVTPAGGKYWRRKCRFNGREKRLALGVYPETTLARRAASVTRLAMMSLPKVSTLARPAKLRSGKAR